MSPPKKITFWGLYLSVNLPKSIIEKANTKHLKEKIEATDAFESPYLVSIDGNKTPKEYKSRPSRKINRKAPKIMNQP